MARLVPLQLRRLDNLVFRAKHPYETEKKKHSNDFLGQRVAILHRLAIFLDNTSSCLVHKKQETRIICLGILDKANGLDLCEALSRMKAFTSCDSTSIFAVKGSKADFRVCKIDVVECKGMGVPLASE